ncbi:signal recognition particle-docking protein FtsY [Candidatus Woesearchaeota archaeon]|nr:signal recognition particle-docking protein FtsY [Candidatus Woesearchaeota archaeon]
MFGRLKEKLKSALSVFSQKAEEEAEVKEVTEEEIKPAATKERVKPEKESPEKKLKTEREVIEQEITAEKDGLRKEIGVQEIPKEEVPEEKKSFFGSWFKKKREEPEPKEESKKEEKVEEKEEPKAPKGEENKSFFEQVKHALATKTISADKFENLFWDLEVALLENNVSVEVIEKIKEDLKKKLVEKPLPREVEKVIEETLKGTLRNILSFEKIDMLSLVKQKKPYIIAFFGINGSGKTTSIAKLVYYFQQHGLSVVLAACDTFRAAAIQQLEEHANRLGVKMIKHDYGSDAAAVAFDAVKYAEKNKIDIVMIDTAGRLHSNTNLMQELEKIIRVTKPHLKLFVGESITGNDCIEQAQRFNDLAKIDGVILTKADVDEIQRPRGILR